MKHYNVTGMSCAACSARVEKAVSSLPDVTACAVNLLTHSMSVEGSASAAEVIGAVEKKSAAIPHRRTAAPMLSRIAKRPLSGKDLSHLLRSLRCSCTSLWDT